MHLWNPINIWQIEFVLIWIYSKGSENRFVVVQHFWCRKICKIVCRVPRKRVKSKFFYQDADVIILADKCIVVRSFVRRNYDKVLMETGKFSDNLRVTEDGLVSGVDRAFKSSNPTFQNIGDRLNPLGKSVDFERLAYSSHASMMILKFWCHENETGSLYFGDLRKTSFRFWLRTILRSPVTIWPYGAYRNSESQQEQGVGFWERPSKSFCCRLALQPNGYSYKKCMATPCIENIEGFYFGQISDSNKFWLQQIFHNLS